MGFERQKDFGTPESRSDEAVTLTIDGREVTVPAGTSVMRAAAEAGGDIPKLCATDNMKSFGSCRLCLVEIEGARGTPASCTTPVMPGMKVKTQTPRLEKLRRGVMELYISDHPLDCLTCSANNDCELVVIAGRERGPGHCIPDWPHPGMGPLAGVAAGLRLAQDDDYESVLTLGVDSVSLPENLLDLLSPAPAYLADQPVVGHWPAAALGDVERILEGTGRHSMLAFAEAVGAKAVKISAKPANINTPADLTAAEKNDGI